MQANIGEDTAVTAPGTRDNNQPHDERKYYGDRNTPATMQRFYYKTWIMTLKVIYMLLLEKIVAPKESAR